jgi:hypothetical protein
MPEKRSDAADVMTLDLFPDLPRRSADETRTANRSHPHRVGGRQGTKAVRRGGGGYLDGRTSAELRADPRLRELAEIGLSATWLGLAQLLGYDQFVAVWRQLSADPALRNDDDQIELRLRPFRSYERYQRNRYIDTLVASGLRPSEIHAMVRSELGEDLSYRHIKRLAAASRVRG